MLVGYMRVSTEDQILASQRAELERAGCERIFEDQASGRLAERPGLEAALDYCRPGDTLVVTRLDRLGRSLKNLLELSARMEGMKIELHSLKESIDTSTSAGRLFFHMMASLAEFQADLIRERTRAGLAEARKRGQLGGSKPKLTPERFALAKQLYDAQQCTVGEIAREFGITRATFYNYLTRAKAKAEPTEAPPAQPAKAPAMATEPEPAPAPEPKPAPAPKPDPAQLYLERRAAFALAVKEARSKSTPLNVAAHLGASPAMPSPAKPLVDNLPVIAKAIGLQFRADYPDGAGGACVALGPTGDDPEYVRFKVAGEFSTLCRSRKDFGPAMDAFKAAMRTKEEGGSVMLYFPGLIAPAGKEPPKGGATNNAKGD